MDLKLVGFVRSENRGKLCLEDGFVSGQAERAQFSPTHLPVHTASLAGKQSELSLGPRTSQHSSCFEATRGSGAHKQQGQGEGASQESSSLELSEQVS